MAVSELFTMIFKIGFVGGLAAASSAARGRIDRGWGPASDGTGGPSPDQMIEKTAKTLRTHCEHIAKTLRPHCENIAKTLRKYCENIALVFANYLRALRFI